MVGVSASEQAVLAPMVGDTVVAKPAEVVVTGAMNVDVIHDLAYLPPESDGLAESFNAVWDSATENLSPEMKAEREIPI